MMCMHEKVSGRQRQMHHIVEVLSGPMRDFCILEYRKVESRDFSS